MFFYFERLALHTIQQLESNLIPLTFGLFILQLSSHFGESEITLKKKNKTNRNKKKQSHGFSNLFPIFLLDERLLPQIGALRRILFFQYSSITHFNKKGQLTFYLLVYSGINQQKSTQKSIR